MTQYNNHIHVHKDTHAFPCWIVSFQGIRIGAAHSIVIAEKAAQIAAHHVLVINLANVCPVYLIDNVAADMAAAGMSLFWTPEPLTGKKEASARATQLAAGHVAA